MMADTTATRSDHRVVACTRTGRRAFTPCAPRDARPCVTKQRSWRQSSSLQQAAIRRDLARCLECAHMWRRTGCTHSHRGAHRPGRPCAGRRARIRRVGGRLAARASKRAALPAQSGRARASCMALPHMAKARMHMRAFTSRRRRGGGLRGERRREVWDRSAIEDPHPLRRPARMGKIKVARGRCGRSRRGPEQREKRVAAVGLDGINQRAPLPTYSQFEEDWESR